MALRARALLITLPLAGSFVSCAELAPFTEAAAPFLGKILQTSGPLDSSTVARGLQEALRVGSDRTVSQVSAPGGFANNALLRIALPKQWNKAATSLRTIGLGRPVDELESAMNRAAETASAEAGAVLWQAVSAMTIQDAFGILNGAPNAATTYFRSKTEPELRTRFTPIVTGAMQTVGVYSAYTDFIKPLEQLPFVNADKLNLEGHVMQGTLDGLFSVLAEQEAEIRENPTAQTTALLKQVFGR
jgi:hypothetical protein